MLPVDSYEPEDTFSFIRQFSSIDLYGLLLIGDFRHPLSKMVSERFDALHYLTGNNILLLAFDPPENYSNLFKCYWEDKLGEKFNDSWLKWQSRVKSETAYCYGSFFNPEIDSSQFPCLVLFNDIDNLENQQVVVVSFPEWNSDDLFKLFKNYIIRAMNKSCKVPKDKRLAYLQKTLNSRTAKIEIHLKHLGSNGIEYAKKHPIKIVVATASLVSALNSNNIISLSTTTVAFLDMIRGKE